MSCSTRTWGTWTTNGTDEEALHPKKKKHCNDLLVLAAQADGLAFKMKSESESETGNRNLKSVTRVREYQETFDAATERVKDTAPAMIIMQMVNTFSLSVSAATLPKPTCM